MRVLPDDFYSVGLSAVDRRMLDFFYEKFVIRRSDIYGCGHFALACYAAFPAVLTPDLLHKIWLNFKNYKWEGKPAVIHRVAPADLLLSPLVEEIGLELYEMAEPVRKALLTYLKKVTSSPEENTFGLYSLQDIAEFLRDYAQFDFTPENKDDNAFREAQVWTAMSYLDPGKAFTQVAKAFQEAASKESMAEMVRYKNAMEKMSGRFSVNIVKDVTMVPKEFLAMTSLTSVVRDVVQNREPSKLEEFKANARNAGENLLTDSPVLDNNVVSIEISDAVEKKIGEQDEKTDSKKRKLRALIIGVRSIPMSPPLPDDIESAKFFATQFKNIAPDAEVKTVFPDNNAGKQTILDAWETLIREAGENDDIIFYLAAEAVNRNNDGHCYIVSHDDDSSTNDKQQWLADEEIGAIAKQARCASLTLILETDHSATKYWLDTSIPGNIVFASAKYIQEPAYLTMQGPDNRHIRVFTLALSHALGESNMQITNRDLFIKTLARYKTMVDEIRKSDASVWEVKAPQLLCHPVAYDRFFAQGKNSRVELQSLLRQTNCYNGPITGDWDKQTATAFASSKKKYGIPDNLFRQDYIEKLKEIRKDQLNEEAVFLFVFSDPQKRSHHIEDERAKIMALLSGKEKALHARIEVLMHPDKKKLIATISNKKNRNRIKLFYYSGFDNRGDFVLKGEYLRLPEFAALLGYQENIALFVSNTCRSQYFADYVSQLGVYRAIGSEGQVDDFLSANFGVNLIKEFVEGRDIDTFMETRTGSVRQKEAPVTLDKFLLFKASWEPKDKLGTEKNIPKAELKKPGLFAVIIGIRTSAAQSYPIDNARRFSTYLSGIHNGNEVKIAPVPVNGTISRRNALDMLNLFSEAREGDTCLLFYSGEAICVDSMEDGFVDFLFSDETEMIRSYVSFKDKLFSVARERNIQLVIIADLHGALFTDTGRIEIPMDSSRFILIQNCSPNNLPAIRTRQADTHNNWFFISLMELLNDGGTHLTYADLFKKLVIRMSQTEEKHRPKMIANPADVVNNVFLTGKGRVKGDYSVWFDADKGWIVNAGRLHGIHPSLYFMRTLLRLSTSQIVAVDKVYENYSTITGAPEDNSSVRFTAELLQNAIPKIKIAFHPAITPSMQQALESAINQYDIYAIDIVENMEEAKYVISSKYNEYSLLVKAAMKERQEAPPVFDHESRPFEFIKQMEYIARWQGILELDNAKAKINDNNIQVSFEVLEGVQTENLATANGTMVNDPDRIILHYQEDKQPAFRCKIKSLSSKRLYATLLYFDSTYGINDLHTYTLDPGQETNIQSNYDPGMFNETIPVFLDEHYEKMGKSEIYDYLKIFIAEEEIDISTIVQSSLKFGQQPITRGIDRQMSPRNNLFELSGSGWSTTTIPIKIVKEPGKESSDEKPHESDPLASTSSNARQKKPEKKESPGILQVAGSFKKEVQKLYDSIPVTVKHDPQKNRWGNQSVNRGKKLTATVEKSSKPGYFNIRITLTAEYSKRPLTGDVAFFLHPTFKEFIRYKKAMSGKAEIIITGYSAFVVGAYTQDGTMLELDLQKVEGYPKEFYYVEKQPGVDDFYTEEGIRELVAERIAGKGDSIENSLLIFQTKEQRTWLVATGKHVYVLLDDEETRKKEKLIMTFFDRSAALPLETKESGKIKGVTVVKFAAQDTWWYYSEELFPTKESLTEAVQQLFVSADQKKQNSVAENAGETVANISIDDSFSAYPVSKFRDHTQLVEMGVEQYFVVDKSIIYFDSSVTTQRRLDVINSILLAQLVADKQFPNVEQGVEWQNYFINVLAKIGWNIESADFSEFKTSGTILEMENAIIDVMVVSFGGLYTSSLSNMMRAVSATLDKQGIMKAFEKNTHSPTHGLFQIALVKEENDTVTLHLGAFSLISTTEIKKILFFKSSRKASELKYSCHAGTLNERIYEAVREAVITKLADKADQFIAQIDI